MAYAWSMVRAVRMILVCLVGVVWLSGCADMAVREQTKKLETSVRNYVLAVRWGNYGSAARYLRARDGTPIETDLDALKDIRVSLYDYAIDAREPGSPEARMTASFEYYYVDTRSVRKTYQQTLWWWDAEREQWYMDGSLPDFPRK